MESIEASLGPVVDIDCDSQVRQWYADARNQFTDYEEGVMEFLHHPGMVDRLFGAGASDILDEDDIDYLIHHVLLSRDLPFLSRLEPL